MKGIYPIIKKSAILAVLIPLYTILITSVLTYGGAIFVLPSYGVLIIAGYLSARKYWKSLLVSAWTILIGIALFYVIMMLVVSTGSKPMSFKEIIVGPSQVMEFFFLFSWLPYIAGVPLYAIRRGTKSPNKTLHPSAHQLRERYEP